MGASILIIITYLILICLTVLAFVKKKPAVGIALSAAMVIGAVVLGILWFTSPM